MHWNEFINVKSRYETLYDICVNDIVLDSQGRKVALEDFILRVLHREQRMLLAVERGVVKAVNCTHVILNPKVSNK